MKGFNKYQLIFKLILFSSLMLILNSCKKDKLNGDVIVDHELLDKLYLMAVDTLKIDSQDFVLETELYRDFFPGVLPEKRRLVALIDLVNTDSSYISVILDIKTLYIIRNENIWISNPVPRQENFQAEYIISEISTNGPEWETGIYVDVVIVIEDINSMVINYLIARDQLIEKVE